MAQWCEHSPPTNVAQVHMWGLLLVLSLPYSERVFFGYSGLSLSSKTNTSEFQFDLGKVSPISVTRKIHSHLNKVIYFYFTSVVPICDHLFT